MELIEKITRLYRPLKLEENLKFKNNAVFGGLEKFVPARLEEITGEIVEYKKELNIIKDKFKEYDELSSQERSELIKKTLLILNKIASKTNTVDFSDLKKPVKYIKGVGPKRAILLEKLGIKNLLDLLLYLPRDYKDRSRITPIVNVKPGIEVTVRGRVVDIQDFKARGKTSILKVYLNDGTGVLAGVWFNQPFQKKNFCPGEIFTFSGKVQEKSWYSFHRKEIANPVYEKDEGKGIHTGRIVPVYPLTEGISQKEFRKVISGAIEQYLKKLPLSLPSWLIKELGILDSRQAIFEVHFPVNTKKLNKARQSLIVEELFLLQWGLLKKKKDWEEKEKGTSKKCADRLIKTFLASLPFDLTGAQKKAWEEINFDLDSEKPMHRLLQGDVGSGKTVIACLALLKGVEAGFQGAFMAPTEILAEQHYQKLQKLLAPLKIEIELLKGGQRGSQRDAVLRKIEDGKANIVVGTHALFQDDVNYNKLGVIVIDEQHRFGVEQRLKLKEKGVNSNQICPDILVMTATPIPRSLALTLYGDLDISIIDELPPGRKPVKTIWKKPVERKKVWDFVEKQLTEGQQAYIVCPLIDESEHMNLEAATEKFQEVRERFENFNVALLHGGLVSEEKKEIMSKFRSGEVHILVSTTVIEVGVDVPNANVMVIEDAQRFGLAQLHQLRGRVGRGGKSSYCILIGEAGNDQARTRLNTMCSTGDGFELAEVDLKLRGPGEFFGTRQHGMPEFKVADLIRDAHLLGNIRKKVAEMINSGCFSSRDSSYLDQMFNIRFPGEIIL